MNLQEDESDLTFVENVIQLPEGKIKFTCASCGKRMVVTLDLCGTEASCLLCGKKFKIPYPSKEPAQPAKKSLPQKPEIEDKKEPVASPRMQNPARPEVKVNVPKPTIDDDMMLSLSAELEEKLKDIKENEDLSRYIL